MISNRRRTIAHRAALTLLLLGLTATTCASVRALDVDCQLPNSPPYTGYSLKIDTECSQYVYCQNGIISTTHTCPDGLLFSGSVGVGGICDWANSVECADDPLKWAFDSIMGVGGGQANVEVVTPRPTPRPSPKPYPQGVLAAPAPRPSNLSGSYTSPIMSGAGNTGNSQSGGGNSQSGGNYNNNIANPENYYCGVSLEDASKICIPCPSGKMSECGSDFSRGCFKGISSCAMGMGATTTASSGGGSASASSGSSIGSSSSGGNNIPQQHDRDPSQQQFTSAQAGGFPMVQAPEISGSGTLSPTLPPWTNAPFAPSPGLSGSKTVIGYYSSWQWYDRDKFANPENIDFTKYDRINYAFFEPDANGNLFGTDKWADPQLLWGPYVKDEENQFMSGPDKNYFCSWDGPNEVNCNHHEIERGLLHLAQSKGVEVVPSIGGWTLSDNFPQIAASLAKRDNFAQQCVDLIMAYGFDGIDIDWEYPGYKPHSGTPADTENFTLLLQAVRQKLDQLGAIKGKFYGLTSALPCGPDKIEKIQVSKVKDYLSELNLMTYDLHGAWDALTGINAPMFDQGWGDKTKRWSVHGCVNTYVEQGAPLSKMNIGLPFYGRSFRHATGMKQFHGGADDVNFHLDEGSPQYFNIVKELKGMTTYRHAKTQTQFAVFNARDRGLVSYDDPQAICDKVDYANRRGMHGFLIWEISGDMIDMGNGNVATPLIDATNAKIANPNYDCSSLRDPLWALNGQTYLFAPDEPETVDWSKYVAPPASTGSATDFTGAQEPISASTVQNSGSGSGSLSGNPSTGGSPVTTQSSEQSKPSSTFDTQTTAGAAETTTNSHSADTHPNTEAFADFVAGGNEEVCNNIEVIITADGYPQEITWEIIDLDTGYAVATGGSDELIANQLVVKSKCLPSWWCYRFTIYDSVGDGLCCDKGIGMYQFKYDGKLLVSSAEFGNSESVEFGKCDDGTGSTQEATNAETESTIQWGGTETAWDGTVTTRDANATQRSMQQHHSLISIVLLSVSIFCWLPCW